jgi:hypothetical protein
MYTTIAYKLALEGETLIRVYEDSTEISFFNQDDAMLYAGYLLGKGYPNVDTYEKMTIPAGGLDIDELKRQDALDKLTPEEKALLGL